ncbi:MAG: ribonuclease HI family protein [Candidatus Babeliales bacterium]
MSQLKLFNSCHPTPPEPKVGGSRWTLFIDGASRKNPGIAGAGVYLLKDDMPNFQKGFYLGHKTNNQAEYLALLLGIFHAKEHLKKVDALYIISDSELLIKQMKGEYKVKNQPLKELFDIAHLLLKDVSYTLCHVRREKNIEADELANVGIDKKGKVPESFIALLKSHGLSL